MGRPPFGYKISMALKLRVSHGMVRSLGSSFSTKTSCLASFGGGEVFLLFGSSSPPSIAQGGGGVVSFNKASLCAKHLVFVFLYSASYGCVEGNCFVLEPFKTLNFPIVIDSLSAHAGR